MCQHLVMAVPPPALTRVAFQPDLDPDLRAACSSHSSGATIKFVAVYEKPMWREENFSGSTMCKPPFAVRN